MYLQEVFEVHNELNPLLWDKNNKLHEDVKTKIVNIVNQFLASIDLDIQAIDVVIVGSNASYNYTSTSDIDVHIITNYMDINADTEIVTLLFNQLRSKFNSTYDITIHGLDVELYVEDVNTSVTSNGIYSIIYDSWIKFPKKLTSIPKYDISQEFSEWQDRIDVAIRSENSSFIKQVIDMLYLIRKNSIAADGEYGKGNQLFKEIRSVGLLKKLKDAYSDAVSKELSLEKMKFDNSNKVLLKEASRNQLLTKSKTTTAGKKRFKQRVKSRVATTVKQYNSIDMNKLFKDNIFSVDIDVQGETNKYTVKISFGGFLDILHDHLKQFNSNKVDLRMVTRSLITGFNRGDVYIHCTCPDFKYVYSYVATKDDTNSGEPENIPARIRNPQDNKGSGCKHTLLVLSNSAWLIKCASVINNYIKYMEKHEKKLYQTIIYPAIYQKEYEEPTKEVNNVVNTEETTETN